MIYRSKKLFSIIKLTIAFFLGIILAIWSSDYSIDSLKKSIERESDSKGKLPAKISLVFFVKHIFRVVLSLIRISGFGERMLSDFFFNSYLLKLFFFNILWLSIIIFSNNAFCIYTFTINICLSNICIFCYLFRWSFNPTGEYSKQIGFIVDSETFLNDEYFLSKIIEEKSKKGIEKLSKLLRDFYIKKLKVLENDLSIKEIVIKFLLMFIFASIAIITNFSFIYYGLNKMNINNIIDINHEKLELLEYLYFSIFSFFSFGFSNIHPNTLVSKFIVSFEVIAGFSLLIIIILSFSMLAKSSSEEAIKSIRDLFIKRKNIIEEKWGFEKVEL